MLKLDTKNYVLNMSPSNSPVSTAKSGDTVIFKTMDCFSNKLSSPEDLMSTVTWANINPATGPLFIEDAHKGDTLKVEILDIAVADHGVISDGPGFGVFGDVLKEETTKVVPIVNDTVVFNDKLQFPINPMIGVIGVAPETGSIPTGTPGTHGGNMDCKKISKGSTLYLPVSCEGALLSIGDVHALMGDGEVVVCGVECAAEVTVKVQVLKDCALPLPFLVNSTHAMSIFSASTMDEAAKGATLNMQSFLTEQLHIPYHEAAMLLSVAGDLAVCQMVDPLITVRMELPLTVTKAYNYQFK